MLLCVLGERCCHMSLCFFSLSYLLRLLDSFSLSLFLYLFCTFISLPFCLFFLFVLFFFYRFCHTSSFCEIPALVSIFCLFVCSALLKSILCLLCLFSFVCCIPLFVIFFSYIYFSIRYVIFSFVMFLLSCLFVCSITVLQTWCEFGLFSVKHVCYCLFVQRSCLFCACVSVSVYKVELS